MQKQKLILGTILFLITFTTIYSYCQNFSSDFSQSNALLSSFSEDPLEDVTTVVGYNVITQSEEIEYFSNTNDEQIFQTIIHPFLGDTDNTNNLEGGNLGTSYPFPPDDRVKITSTSNYPWSTICKLYVTAADNTHWVGSGAIIDAFHVLTCGHLVYLHDNGGWVNDVTVIPGMRGSYQPFGQAFATYYRSYVGWTQDEMVEHDWALITLDRPIGNQTGWMGRITEDILDPIYMGTLHTAGYPSDLDSGEYMYYDSDFGEKVDNYNHWYWMDTAEGQSGSPVWAEINGSNYILTVNAYQYENGFYANFGIRLNQDKFNQLNFWLSADPFPDYTPNGWESNLILIIAVIAIIGVTVVVIAIIVASRRSTPTLTLVEPYEDNFNLYDSEDTISLSQQLNSQVFGFCPKCGKEIFRVTQRYCSNCGLDFFNLDSEE